MEMKLPLIAMEQFLNHKNDSLFEDITLPDGIDKDTFVDCLMMSYGEFGTAYPSPEFQKFCTTTWAKKWYRTFDKWITALNLEYNPLENYNRVERGTHTLTKDGSIEVSDTGTDTITQTFNNVKDQHSGSIKDVPTNWTTTHSNQDYDTSTTSETVSTTTTNDVSAYDTSSLTTASKTTVDVDPSVAGNTSVEYDSSNPETTCISGTYEKQDTITNTKSGNIENETEYGKVNTTSFTDYEEETSIDTTVSGNIGVTTSQQMLQSELELQKFNIYEQMCDMYARELLLMVM